MVVNDQGTDVPKRMLTPAECQLLRAMYESIVRTNPVTNLQLIMGKNDEPAAAAVIVSRASDDLENESKFKLRMRTNADEKRRLVQKYGEKPVNGLFPGLNPNMPATFEEAGFEMGLAWQEPSRASKGKAEPTKRGPSDDDSFIFMDVPEGFDASKELVEK